MKKLFALLSAFTVVLTSCSSDDSSNESSTILVTKIIETYEDGSTYTENFYYNGNKLIKVEDSDGESETFVYDSNGKLISGIEKYYDGSNLITGNVNYVYNAQNKLSSIEYHDNLHFDYTYNSNGTITEDNYDSNGFADTFIYTFLNNNVVAIEESSIITTYQFDTKNSPFMNVYSPYELFRSYFDYDYNNATNKLYNNSTADSRSSTYTYIYNSDNFPIKRTETTGDGEIIITEYFYNN
ncbi:hypothetical protein GOQ30_09075 [Flavobacterium sp. TP390]|uniref:YD repeat-containing protein n=1 Tax=Flavobacterium profundi TaxID=1774945 RepID=A0A6I4II57_9FLAO|nr:hypothetical protein [Flavobacterium profundi]MVO09308.1 hypothetical protein [Flavobacterium profundi]